MQSYKRVGEKMTEKISKEEAKEQAILMAKRCALLYQVFAETLVDELGEEKGAEVIAKVIKKYGIKSGEAVKAGVKEQGLDLSIGNYGKVPELPKVGWITKQKSLTKDRMEVDVLYCPMAEQWIDEGAAKLGRLYCHVDQAKYAAYNPDFECIHKNNVLDGDAKCTIVVKRKE